MRSVWKNGRLEWLRQNTEQETNKSITKIAWKKRKYICKKYSDTVFDSLIDLVFTRFIFKFLKRFLKSVAYREFCRLVYGTLGKVRIPLPSCAYNSIRLKFKVEGEHMTGFEEDD